MHFICIMPHIFERFGMSTVNKMILIGHLGRAPEISTTKNGSRAARLSIATTETWKDKTTGERKQRTDWHAVVIFNETIAGVVETYCHKGSKVYVEGKHQSRKYSGRDGVEKSASELVINGFGGTLVLLDKKEADSTPMPEADDYGGEWATQ